MAAILLRKHSSPQKLEKNCLGNLTKLGRDKVLMTPHICIDSWAKSAQGWIQGGAKIGHGGFPSPKNFFFRPEGYSNILNA